MELVSVGPVRLHKTAEWVWELACEGSGLRRGQASCLCVQRLRRDRAVEQAVRPKVVSPIACRDALPRRILGATKGLLRDCPTSAASLAGVGLRASDPPGSWSRPPLLRQGAGFPGVAGHKPRLRWNRRTWGPIPDAVSKRACAQGCPRPRDRRALFPRRKSGPCASRYCDGMQLPQESQLFGAGGRTETLPAVQLECRL
jgi:hypothetical protein